MKQILFTFLFFSFVSTFACDCDVAPFIQEIANADLSIRGTVIEETEVSYSYRNLKLPLKVKVKIEEKYYGIELRDTIEVVASKSWSGFYGLSLQKGEEVLLNLYFGETGYVFPSHCCSINSLAVEQDSVETGWQGKYHYQDFEQKIVEEYGPFHQKVNKVSYGDLKYMDIQATAYQKWDFVMKPELADGIYWVYDFVNGKVITREYVIFYQHDIRKIKKYYSNQQVALEQFFSKQQLAKETEYYQNGQRKSLKEFEKGKLMTQYLYWENGQMYQRMYNKGENYFSYEKWNKQGVQEYNGELKQGKYVGEIILYNDKGEIVEQALQNDKGYTGTRWFIVDNRLLYIENYENGLLNGDYVTYVLPYQYLKKGIDSFVTWEDGKVKIKNKLKESVYTKGQYIDGQKDGEWVEYNFSNKRKVSGIIVWEKGKQISSKYFTSNDF